MSNTISSESVQELVPRQYQTEIYLQAQKGNIIAVLETGTGKTLIAVQLLRWITSRVTDERNAPRTAVIFLVPKVPLVDQQRAFISSQTSLTVRGYIGEMNVDYWERAKWEEQFAAADVLVMTPQIFYDLLNHAHWSIDKVSLLIFDEVHHCRKNHPYNQIMRDHYYRCDASRRPKIFGMTASPIWNLKQPLVALRELEQNMNSRVLSVKANQEELQRHIPRPVEIPLLYPPSPSEYPSYTFPDLWEVLGNLGFMSMKQLDPRSIETRYYVTKDSLGIYGAQYYLFAMLPKTINALVKKFQSSKAVGSVGVTPSSGKLPALDPTSDAAAITGGVVDYDVQIARLQRMKAVLAEPSAHFSLQAPDVQSEWLSPKLTKLVELLAEHYGTDPNCQAIVFAEQRQIVACLAWILPKVSSLHHLVKTVSLAGHGGFHGSKLDFTGMDGDTQRQAVQDFRDAKANLLIATSVAEEGLDFQPCNLVVRFDELHTMVSYAQSRGRARHKVSSYIVMQPEGTTVTKYEMFARAEPELKTSYQTRIVKDITEEEEDDEPINAGDYALREEYRLPSGAVLQYASGISRLAMLCACLQADEYSSALRPVYDYHGGYFCTVELPSALPLPREALKYVGPSRTSKKESKRAVAFEAVRALHKLGSYDNYLLPLRGSTDAEGEDADGESFVGLEIPDMMDTTVFDVWGDPWKSGMPLWCHSVVLDGNATTGLVTSRLLEPGDVNDYSGCIEDGPRIGAGIQLLFASEDDRISALDLMEKFTVYAKDWALTRRSPRGRLSCFLIPIHLGNLLPDYDMIRQTLSQPICSDWSSIGPEHQGKLLVIEKGIAGPPYLLNRFRFDLTPSTPFALSGHKCCRNQCANFMEHLRHERALEAARQADRVAKGWKRKASLDRSSTVALDEPMVEIKGARSRDAMHGGENRTVPLSFLDWLSLPLTIFYMFETLPPLARHISKTFRARLSQELLRLPRYPLGPFVEALSVPGAGDERNYNRLETLGDTFLKLSNTVYVFNKYRHRHEGQLTALRTNSVRNLYLRGKAYRMGIYQFTTCDKVRQGRRWLPPTTSATVYDGDIAYTKTKVPRRCLPDCVESLLGAAYLSGGFPAVLQAGTSMGLCFGGIEPWISRYKVHAPIQRDMPTGLKPLENALGYKFRDPLLLLEAMTHQSFIGSQTPSYNRLEFLGDALIETHVTEYVFRKFPTSTAAQLTWMKHMLTCNPMLSSLSIRGLSLHKYLLALSPLLDKAIAAAVVEIENWTYESLVFKWWEFSPPKVLNDLLEAVMGAVLVDSGFDLDVARPVVDRVFEKILQLARPDLPKHPVSALMIWVSKNGCTRTKYKKECRSQESLRNDTYCVLVHGVEVSAVTRESLSIAKCFAASEANQKLSDPEGEFFLGLFCDCPAERELEAQKRKDEKAKQQELKAVASAGDHEDVDMEGEKDEDADADEMEGEKDEDADADEMEVEALIRVEGVLSPEELTNIIRMDIDAQPEGSPEYTTDETEEGFTQVGRLLLHALEPESTTPLQKGEGGGDEV